MKPQFLKLTQEVKNAIAEKMATKEVQDLFAKMSIKASDTVEDFGRFEMIVSTAVRDRSGEIVDQNGWDLGHYKNNPVVLWGHDYQQMPVGVTDEIYLNEKDQLVAVGRFAPTPFAQELRKLYDAKILRAASVGFIVKEMEGKTITKSELIEWSFVSVPANPEALSIAKEIGLDVDELRMKGVISQKEGEIIDNNDIEDDSSEPQKEQEKTADESEGQKTDVEKKDEEADHSEEQKEEENGQEEKGISITISLPKNLTKSQLEAITSRVKGKIEDELQFDADDYWKKWENIDLIEPIIYKFYDIYFRNSTKSDEFIPLVQEMIMLFERAIEESKVEEKSEKIEQHTGEYETAEAKAMVRAKEEAKLAQKVGAQLLEMQGEIDDAVVRHAQSVLAIIEEDIDAEEKKVKLHEVLNSMQKAIGSVSDTEGVESPEETKEERSKTSEFDAVMKSLDDYINVQKILRTVATATTKGLEDINKKIAIQKKKSK